MLGPGLDQAAGYARAEKSAVTRRAYRSDFRLFRTWCGAKQVTSLPAQPETVAAFLAARQTAVLARAAAHERPTRPPQVALRTQEIVDVMSSDKKVLDFPKAEITSEEKARRAMAEARRLARLFLQFLRLLTVGRIGRTL
jgi:hypothetical protein